MPPAPASPVQASPVRFAVAGMIAMIAAMGIGRFVYTPILPGMMEGLGLSAADAGLIASANYVGYFLGALAAAAGWAQGHERRLMLAGLGASALLCFAMAMVEALPAFLVIRFVAGLAAAFLMVFAAAIVFSHLAVAGRTDLQAWHFGGVGLGIAISGAMIGALTLAGDAWQAGWVWSGVLSTAGFAAVAIMIDRGPATAGPATREPQLPSTLAMRGTILAYGLFGFGYIITATFLVAIVRQSDAGRFAESAVWIAAGLAGFPSVWLWQFVVARIGLVRTFALGCVVEAIGVMASVTLGGTVGPLIGGVLLGGTFIAVTAFGLQAGRTLAGPSPRRAMALMTAAFGFGQILGPIVAGYAADLTGDFVLASGSAALALMAAAGIALTTARRA